MMRTSAVLLALGVTVLVLVPAAAAETFTLEREVSTDALPGLDADPATARDSLPDVAIPVRGILPEHRDDADGRPVTAADGRTEPAARKSSISGLPPEAERAVAVAGTGAGLALLLGLLAHALGLPLFSRIQSSRLLDNGVRQRVHDTVVANPGITIKEITGVCAIGWGTAVYHLKRLEAERLLVSERNRQFRRYFKNGGGIVNDAKSAFAELKNPVTERLAQSIVQSPGSCQKDLCGRVGISAPLAHKFLSRLADAGLVSTQREWKTVKYFPTPKLEGLLLVARPAVVPTLAAALVPAPVAVAA